MTRVFNEAILFKEEVVEGCVAARGRFAWRASNACVVKARSLKLGERGRAHEKPGAASTVLVPTAAGEAFVEGSRHDDMQAGSGSEGGEG